MTFSIKYNICTDENKIRVVAALKAGHDIINNDDIDIDIKNVVFELTHLITDLVIEKEENNFGGN